MFAPTEDTVGAIAGNLLEVISESNGTEISMKYNELGNSSLEVRRACLGCMGLREDSSDIHDWGVNEVASRLIIKWVLALGINFFDTANAYSLGSREEIVKRALWDVADRDEVEIATKVHFPWRLGRNACEVSRNPNSATWAPLAKTR